ncbi:hypothetical protein BDQ17DRAFT_1498218 [Cyathus striatus]|nr:hypothetical protein BDQ17DRAFT_1498218 [Cyathus striatus]
MSEKPEEDWRMGRFQKNPAAEQTEASVTLFACKSSRHSRRMLPYGVPPSIASEGYIGRNEFSGLRSRREVMRFIVHPMIYVRNSSGNASVIEKYPRTHYSGPHTDICVLFESGNYTWLLALKNRILHKLVFCRNVTSDTNSAESTDGTYNRRLILEYVTGIASALLINYLLFHGESLQNRK